MNFKVPETARLEIKFVGYETHFHTILSWLHLHPAHFIEPFPDRRVNNIYFDTHDYAAFSENLIGASSRAKVRYRWYGTEERPAPGTLEIKCKRNYFGWKQYYKISSPPYHQGANWFSIRNAIQAQLPQDGRKWLDTNSLPVLINRYHRKYFASLDEKVRATVDTKQAVWDQRLKPYPNFKHRANLPQTLVVEFKFDRNDRDLASEVLQGFPMRVGRHSKYINGVRAISER